MENPILSSRPWNFLLALLACALFLLTPAQADPAGRIGRIAWLSGPGAVNLYNPDTSESYSAALNQPLTSGDTLTTVAGSRAEIQIGSMSVRLDSGSMLEIDRIDDDQVRLYLNEGRAIVKLPSREVVGEFELVTRNGRFSARNTGIYRIDADSGSSSATAYSGALHFETSDRMLDIGAGQSAQFWQQGDGQTRYRLSSALNDDFSEWSFTRDQRPTANTYARYVSPEMTGAEDLDAYGNWSENAEYGAIWTPRAVAADWVPYRSGHWVWVAPWGWNWVGYEPWGFAPFHYGRWVHHHGRWGWVPGRRIARPVYAPAMVAWIGAPGIGGSIAMGNRPKVGWFPLAPHEVYVPAYRSSPKHVREINITHVKNIGNVTNIVNNPQAVVQHTRYRHRELPHAVTVVPADVVTHRRSVSHAAVSPRDHHSLRDQPVQALAPVSVPQAAAQNGTRNRQDRPNPTFTRRESERQGTPVATPAASGRLNVNSPSASTAVQIPATMPQRVERPMPETVRPATQTRPEAVAPVRQSAAAPASGVQAPQQVESQNWLNGQNRQERQDRPGQPFDRRDRDPQGLSVSAPATPGNRNGNPQAASTAAQLPATMPQRVERPMPETVRPATLSRPEAVAPVRQSAAAPASGAQAPQQVESQNWQNGQNGHNGHNGQNRQERQDRPGQPLDRRDRDPQGLSVSSPATPGNRNGNPQAASTAAQIPATMPQRGERPMPETVRPATQSRPEAVAPVRQNAAAPASGMQAAPQVESQNWQNWQNSQNRLDRPDRPDQPTAGRERQQQEALVTPAVTPVGRNSTPPALVPIPQSAVLAPQRNERPQPETVRPVPQSRTEPMVYAPPAARNREFIPPAPASIPQAPAVAPQRSERPMPEVARPVPQSRPEPVDVRTQDRPSRRVEPAMTPPPPAARIESPPQQFRQAAPARMETPPPMVREINRPAEPHPEARTQNQGDRQRAVQNDQEKQRHQREQAEKR